jgi:hypothetical protein
MYLLNICSFKFKTWSNTWSRLFEKQHAHFTGAAILKAWGSHSKMQYALREVLFVLRKHVSFGRCIRCCPGSSRLTAYAFYQKATFPFQHFPEDCRAPFKQVICVLSEAVFKEVQFSKKQLWVRDAAFPKK